MRYIFLHGLGQSEESWMKVLPFLDLNEECIVPDLFYPEEGRDVTYQNLYGAFKKDLEKYDEPLCLCGLSLGGIFALNYAIEYPWKVSSLVLIGTQFTMPKKLLKFQNVIFSLLPKKAFKSSKIGKSEMIKLSKSMMDLDFSSKLIEIKMPTLLIVGEKDASNMKASRMMNTLIQDSEFCVIQGAGHEVNTDAPEALARALEKWFLK